VIHAVGPFYNEESAEKARLLLHQVHIKALEAAAYMGCRSIAFPAISTGAYRFPMQDAAPIAVEAAAERLRQPQPVALVRFVLFKPAHLELFGAALQALMDAQE
jgi:O-acetyl-ADP-ribose deacetylase (regulator of RNase III)